MEHLPPLGQLEELCPSCSREEIRKHLENLDSRYFQDFTTQEIAEHICSLHTVMVKEEPIVSFEESEGHQGRVIRITIYAFNYPGVFSLITGILSSAGFDIKEGIIYTYSRGEQEKTRRRGYSRRGARQEAPPKRKIIDQFIGNPPIDISREEWQEMLGQDLKRLFHILLQDKKKDGEEKARKFVLEKVAWALGKTTIDTEKVLYPVEISMGEREENRITMKILSQDTPFFLFSISSVFAYHDLSIERVQITTMGSRVEDEFEIAVPSKNVSEEKTFEKVQFSILLTKQFTYFLDRSPDPYRAFLRFESMVQEIRNLPPGEELNVYLSEPRVLKGLARLLGTSDFLWEDFLRLQYENIIPLLEPNLKETDFSTDDSELPPKLARELQEEENREKQIEILNRFKDREAYLIDLDHILNPEKGLLFLSKKLTVLAELVVRKAAELAEASLTEHYGTPRTFAGLEGRYAIMGLGKFGGAALGYASDIELLFIYGDNGRTDGKKSIKNAEYYERLFKEITRIIQAKREGIFRVDLRLRPYGSSGSIACSLETFCTYYSPAGDAHSFERLALIRMRRVAGEKELGERIERIRDELIYSSESVGLKELRELRQKQLEEKSKPGKQNAKFSPGGLVDLESTVQILQCVYGKNNPELRTPRIHLALEALTRAGQLSPEKAERLTVAYHFFRRLINGLRMLRGSAKDLFLPEEGGMEFSHLARRMGYTEENGVLPARRLRLDFENHTALVRTFVEEQLGRDALPGPPQGNMADVVLSASLPEEKKLSILSDSGFQNPSRSLVNLTNLAGKDKRKQIFAELAVLAGDILKSTPDPDMALNNWERFVTAMEDPREHFRDLLSQPRRAEILLRLFSGSQFLSDTLIQEPQLYNWVSEPDIILKPRDDSTMTEAARKISSSCTSWEEWRSALRQFRKREILRIGTRDICLGTSLDNVVKELSSLARVILMTELERICSYPEQAGIKIKSISSTIDDDSDPPLSSQGISMTGFTLLAFGKLGGRELNYSSDIDLLCMYDDRSNEVRKRKEFYPKVVEVLRADLSEHTTSGYAYRVDLRLRPYGRSGKLVQSVDSLVNYYENKAWLWEVQSLLKLSPVAGDLKLGDSFIRRINPLLKKPRSEKNIVHSIVRLRLQARKGLQEAVGSGFNIKNGWGGIRDIEFLIQGLQLLYASQFPDILTPSTLEAMKKLDGKKILPGETIRLLESDYIVFRRIEHFLQIYDDRQTHTLPASQQELTALSKRLVQNGRKPDDIFLQIEESVNRVRELFHRELESRV